MSRHTLRDHNVLVRKRGYKIPSFSLWSENTTNIKIAIKKSQTRKLFIFISKTLLYQKNSSKKYLGSNNSLPIVKTAPKLQRKNRLKLYPLHSNPCSMFNTSSIRLRILPLKLDYYWNPPQKIKLKSNDRWRRSSSSKIIQFFTFFIVETSLQIQYQSYLDQKTCNQKVLGCI